MDLVVASPLKRTIYTALKSFPKPLESKNLKVIVLPELQETSDLPCDTGSDVAELEREFQGQRLDLANLHTPENATWNNKKDRWAPDSDAILARAKVARLWLLARPEKDIVVVTHGGFLHYFTDDWSNSHRFEGMHSCYLHRFHHKHHLHLLTRTGTGWANTEFRSYNFDTSSDALLVETQESKDRRAGHDKPLSKEELKNLSRTTTNKWAEPGYQRASTIQAKV